MNIIRYNYKLLALLGFLFFLPLSAQANDDVYWRVDRTKTVNCGFVSSYPLIWFNASKQVADGILPEYLAATAARQKLKIKWSREISADAALPLLKAGRIDMMCSPLSYRSEEAKNLNLIASPGNQLYFSYVAHASRLTDDQIKRVKVAYIDDGRAKPNVEQMFGSGPHVRLAAGLPLSTLMDQLKYAKVDAVIMDELEATNYMKVNPKTIRKFVPSLVYLKPMSLATIGCDTRWAAMAKEMVDPTDAENATILRTLAKKYGVRPEVLGVTPQ